MLNFKNAQGFKFLWPDGSDFVEVYHANASHADLPVWAISAKGLRHELNTLKRMSTDDPTFNKGL